MVCEQVQPAYKYINSMVAQQNKAKKLNIVYTYDTICYEYNYELWQLLVLKKYYVVVLVVMV
jgi:hypothetical protein